jgi:glycosyltransferase involved in cell wall biosynthesis
MQPLVSIVTPSYNQAPYLEVALRSVLAQDYANIEYIVIDGGSTDGSIEIIEQYQDRLAYWVSGRDSGQAEAINKGMRRATGDIIGWVNSDDALLPGAISRAVEELESDADIGMVYGDGLMVDRDLMLLDKHTYKQLSVLDLLCFEVILQPTVFMRRNALEDVGYLNEGYHLILDHELWVRLASRYPLSHVPEFWAIERTHESAKTIQQAAGFVEEARRLIDWAAESEELADLVAAEKRRIEAGFNVFAARRLIDADEFDAAVRHLSVAMRLHPPTVAKYWYKVVQAVFSALGLSEAFMWYRRSRRSVTHQGQFIDVLGKSLSDDPPS